MLYNKDFVQFALNSPKLEFMYKEIKKIQNIKILELGVERGVSTSMFLKLCEQNNGRIISVDIENCANLFQNDRWNFIQSRDDNFEIINNLDQFVKMNFPVLLGASRKSFIGVSLNLPENDRLEGSIAANIIGLQKGAKIFRVHDVVETNRAMVIANKIFNSNNIIS